MSDLNDFINSDIDIVAETAKQTTIYQQQLADEKITLSEYNELLDNLVATVKLYDNMCSLHVQKTISQLVDAILRIKELASII